MGTDHGRVMRRPDRSALFMFAASPCAVGIGAGADAQALLREIEGVSAADLAP